MSKTGTPKSFLTELAVQKKAILRLLCSRSMDFDSIVAALSPETYPNDPASGMIAIALIQMISDRKIFVSFSGRYPAAFTLTSEDILGE
jgi:hypothetical protein